MTRRKPTGDYMPLKTGKRREDKAVSSGLIRIRSRALNIPLLIVTLWGALLLFSLPVTAQTESLIYNFCSLRGTCDDGDTPLSVLTFDSAGNLYGTTNNAGGRNGSNGNVFELSPNSSGGWTETVLHTFGDQPDGAHPQSSPVIFDSAGNLYGTTADGGAWGTGTVYELSPTAGGTWNETILHNFYDNADGGYPFSGVIMDKSGNLYGTTLAGGSKKLGIVFELSPSSSGWKERVLYNFTNKYDYSPSGLAMDANGNIFGAAGSIVFELSPNASGGWDSNIIYTFPRKSLANDGTPVIDQYGNIFGTIWPENDKGPVGTESVYRLAQKNGEWEIQILQSWTNGQGPESGVVLDNKGNIYGASAGGGAYGDGTVFELIHVKDKDYKPVVLWNFDGTDGETPFGSLTLDSAGNLYGTTAIGGSIGFGTVFEITP
jgi:uncharacterized repeat protein (TIGR03803 family)